MSEIKRSFSLAGSIALIVIGLLILIPSCLCTGLVAIVPLVQMLTHPGYGGAPLTTLPVALTFGLPFIVGGAVMIYQGVSRIRANRRSDEDNLSS